VNQGSLCNDGDACTTQDICSGGACKGLKTNCDDANPCTDDSCDTVTGCINADNTAICDDNNACTTGDKCVAGSCVVGTLNCNDSDPCTLDSCDTVTGCNYVLTSPSCGICNAGPAIGCGDTISSALPADLGGTIPGYGCLSGTLDASETIYTFTATADATGTVILSNASPNVAVAVVEEVGGKCRSKNCIAGTTAVTSFAVKKSQIYYLIVDSPATTQPPQFSLTLSCN
jgi:hypothetical protein